MKLNDLDREQLMDLVEYLYQGGKPVDMTPQSFSVESTYKDALYSGYIDKDLEFTSVVPSLSNVTVEDTVVKLNGDVVDLIPEYKSINLYCKGFKITGLIKAEIIDTMLINMESMKIGDYMGWSKHLIQYKGHTLVANTKGAIAGLKLLKNDYMAKKMYKQMYPKSRIQDWSTLKESEKIYGSSEISMPNIVDQRLEETYNALELIKDSIRYTEVANMVRDYGFIWDDPSEIERLQLEVSDLQGELNAS